MTTLAKEFAAYRIEQKLSVAELARKTKLERVTIWKIETGKSVRADTLKRALRGMGITERSPRFAKFFAIWTDERTGGTAGRGLPSYLNEKRSAGEEMVRQLMADIPTAELPLVLKAVSDPAIRALLPALLALRTERD